MPRSTMSVKNPEIQVGTIENETVANRGHKNFNLLLTEVSSRIQWFGFDLFQVTGIS